MARSRNDLTYKEVASRYIYNHETGELFSKLSNRVVGGKTTAGYLTINIKQKYYLVHRIAWLLYYREWPSNDVDHIDGNPGNNRICNLRVVTHVENCRNRKLNSNNTSGKCGVAKVSEHATSGKKRWKAYMYISLGYYHTKEEAIAAREKAELKYYGKISRG